MALMQALAAALLLLASPALDKARADLAKGRLEELVLALQPKDAVPADEGPAAAELLTRAAARAREKGDRALALMLAQTAIRRQPGFAAALELLCRWSLAEKEFSQAWRYSAAWTRAHPDDPKAKQMAARVAAEDKGFRPIPIIELHKRTRASAPVPSAAPASEDDAAGLTSARSAHFRIVYTRGTKDWSERGRYEVTALDLLERAWVEARGQLGDSPPGPFEVVLYTHEEFSQRFGAGAARGVLGFYAGKIRMNLSESLDERFHATALHELVHAALDALAGGRGDRLPTWLNEGMARFIERKALSGDFLNHRELRLVTARGERLPLSSMASRSFLQLGGDIELAYAKSAAAVAALVGQGEGMVALTRLVRALGRGSSFESAFVAEFGRGRLGSLDAEAVKAARHAGGE